jgi:hypothetical protein
MPSVAVGGDERDQALVHQPPEGLFGHGPVVTECRVAVRAQEAALLDQRARAIPKSTLARSNVQGAQSRERARLPQAVGRFQHERAVVLHTEPRPGELEEDGARSLQQEIVRVTVA